VIAPYETDQQAFLAKIKHRPDVRVRVNCDVEAIAHGPWERIRADVDRIVNLVGDRPNACLGTGVLPYDTLPESVFRLQNYVRAIQSP
jgi:hypothetical protein